MIKLGGHVFPSAEQNAKDPELLAHLAKQMGYQAAYAPDYLTIDKPDEIRIARKAFEKEGILIAGSGLLGKHAGFASRRTQEKPGGNV